jgi:LacI family transcriptional regulator
MKMKKQIKLTSDPSGRITLDDVAAHAGVSRSTASLVVRNSVLIPPETHKRVRASMTALGYVYNHSAANLRTKKTKILGMIIADISNPFYAILASGIEKACNEREYVTIFADTGESADRQRLIVNRLIEHNVAGVFLCPAGEATKTDMRALDAVGIPAVLIMRYLQSYPASYVGPDNIKGARLAVDHLVSLGHRRIAMIGGPAARSASIDRLRGFRDGMAGHGLAVEEALIAASEIDRRSAMDVALKFLSHRKPPTAIFCYNDIMAFGVMLAGIKLGLQLGRDLAVIGFDDIPESQLWTPPLTTVAIDPRNIGQLAANELLKKIDNPSSPNLSIVVEPRLVVRESCGEALTIRGNKQPSDESAIAKRVDYGRPSQKRKTPTNRSRL